METAGSQLLQRAVRAKLVVGYRLQEAYLVLLERVVGGLERQDVLGVLDQQQRAGLRSSHLQSSRFSDKVALSGVGRGGYE